MTNAEFAKKRREANISSVELADKLPPTIDAEELGDAWNDFIRAIRHAVTSDQDQTRAKVAAAQAKIAGWFAERGVHLSFSQ